MLLPWKKKEELKVSQKEFDSSVKDARGILAKIDEIFDDDIAAAQEMFYRRNERGHPGR